MKTLLIGTTIACVLLFSACGGRETAAPEGAEEQAATSEEKAPAVAPAVPPVPVSPGSPGTPAAPTAGSAAAGRSATDATTDEMGARAAAAFADVGERLTADAAVEENDRLETLAVELGDQVRELARSLQANEELTGQLQQAVQALLQNQDVDAVSTLNSLADAGLTSGQQSALKETYNIAAAFVTERNFSSLEGADSEVAAIVDALRDGNYQAALQPLQTLWSEADLTDRQQELLSGIFDQVAPGWRDAAETLDKAGDAARSLGL